MDLFRFWFEHFFVLPIRWYHAHIGVWRELRQRCKSCGQADGFNFDVPDDTWAAVVPPTLRNRVVCLRCFDRFAKEKEVDYATSLWGLCFAGDKGSLGFEVASSVNVRRD